MGFIEGLIEYKWVIAFYLAIILFVIIYRKKFEFQGKIIAMYRTKFGLKLIDKVGTKYAELIKLFGYISIGVGFIGMFAIMIILIKGLYDLFFLPNAPPVISPVLPGVPIPGLGITVPLIEGWIVLFIAILVHEFSHGIVSKAHGVKINSTGIFFLGPLMGAFVEPDEKQLAKKDDVVKYSIIAAGPTSNFLLALLVVLIMAVSITPLANQYVKNANELGVQFTNIDENFPAHLAGMQTDEIYTFINNESVSNLSDFSAALEKINVGDPITIGNEEKTYSLIASSRPENTSRAVIGVNVRTKYDVEDKLGYKIISELNLIATWLIILSFSLGLGNLLPLGPVDGGQMLREALTKISGKKKGTKIWVKISILLLIVLVALLIISFF